MKALDWLLGILVALLVAAFWPVLKDWDRDDRDDQGDV